MSLVESPTTISSDIHSINPITPIQHNFSAPPPSSPHKKPQKTINGEKQVNEESNGVDIKASSNPKKSVDTESDSLENKGKKETLGGRCLLWVLDFVC
jgi:hypothetical protein